MELIRPETKYLQALDVLLKETGLKLEGNCGDEGLGAQREFLNSIPRRFSTNRVSILEIGFNAGHSSICFLANNPNVKLTSVDIGEHEYLRIGREFIKEKFPDQHKVIIGDSREVIPALSETHKYDIILIDGDHSFEGVTMDINSCIKVAHPGSIVIGDDVISDPEMHKPWTIETTMAWNKAVEAGVLEQRYSLDMKKGRGFAVARYKFTEA